MRVPYLISSRIREGADSETFGIKIKIGKGVKKGLLHRKQFIRVFYSMFLIECQDFVNALVHRKLELVENNQSSKYYLLYCTRTLFGGRTVIGNQLKSLRVLTEIN